MRQCVSGGQGTTDRTNSAQEIKINYNINHNNLKMRTQCQALG